MHSLTQDIFPNPHSSVGSVKDLRTAPGCSFEPLAWPVFFPTIDGSSRGFCGICRRQCHYEFNTVFSKSCKVYCAKPKEVDPLKPIGQW